MTEGSGVELNSLSASVWAAVVNDMGLDDSGPAHRREKPRGAGRRITAYGWLGAGAMTLGVGAALVGGSGVAHADTGEGSGSSAASSRADAPAKTVKTGVVSSRPSTAPSSASSQAASSSASSSVASRGAMSGQRSSAGAGAARGGARGER
ncbi:hypothetical protein [Mycolicibacterium sarraceniae]|uniref:hypothetical protein n=1 Tax=Mycolicibacterium sarraceniae TaxID=1534348 RepID=UPI0013D4F08C|nr:hypothetical protein [Mycolicibacterium sarraceniae]